MGDFFNSCWIERVFNRNGRKNRTTDSRKMQRGEETVGKHFKMWGLGCAFHHIVLIKEKTKEHRGDTFDHVQPPNFVNGMDLQVDSSRKYKT